MIGSASIILAASIASAAPPDVACFSNERYGYCFKRSEVRDEAGIRAFERYSAEAGKPAKKMDTVYVNCEDSPRTMRGSKERKSIIQQAYLTHDPAVRPMIDAVCATATTKGGNR